MTNRHPDAGRRSQMISKRLLLSGILLMTAWGLKGTALPQVSRDRMQKENAAAQPSGQLLAVNPNQSPTAAAAEYPSRFSYLLPLPPLTLPDLLLPPYDFPSFNSQRLDQELQLYLQYIRAHGKPDILIMGSSRSLQGIDPAALEAALAAKGLPHLKVYNFGINGATAQVMNLLVQEILTPEQLPRLIIWGDGSRAFNSGRPDRTFGQIRASAGYQKVSQGARPIPSRPVAWEIPSLVTTVNKLLMNSGTANSVAPDLTEQGFQIVSEQYNPNTYYRHYPWVPGQFDGDYHNFTLNGPQTSATTALANFTRKHGITLVFVNLPLTRDYLDPVRRGYEADFRQHMWQLASREHFMFRDLSQQAELMQNHYFADPSHINQHGARAIAFHLVADPTIPWQMVDPSSSTSAP